MINLWRYWPVRMLGGYLFLLPMFGLALFSGHGIGSGNYPAALAAAVAAIVGTVGGWAGISRLNKAAGIKPGVEHTVGELARMGGLMMLPFPMIAAGLIALNILFPDPESLRYLARILVVLVAIFPPFLFAANATPRGRRHWAVLGACIPAMYAASLAAPFAAGAVLRALSAGEPGMAVKIAGVVLAYLVLNAPFALLLVKGGVCPLKDRPVSRMSSHDR